MDRTTRKKLDMVRRVYALSTAHQSEIAGYVEAVRTLNQGIDRADALLSQQNEGGAASTGSANRREELRRRIRKEHVVHLVRIARASLPEDPELRARFRMPQWNRSQQDVAAEVRAMLA